MARRRADPPLITTMESASSIAGALVAIVGGLVLLGWTLDVTILKSVRPGLSPMAPNTALAFVLAGASLALSLAAFSGRGPRNASRAAAAAVALVGLLSLSEYLFGWELGVDQILFRDPQSEPGVAPGRMAPATALGFVLVGLAQFCLGLASRRARLLTQGLALVVAAIGLVALVGYLYGARSLYTHGPYVSMALHTASLFVVLSCGILLAQPTTGLMADVTSATAGGFLARRLLPAVLIIPLLLGWLLLLGERAGLYDSVVRLALTVVSSIVALAATVLWSARSLHRIDLERRRGIEALRESEELLKRAQALAHLGSWELDLVGNQLTWSDEVYRIFGLEPQEFGATYEAFLEHVHPDDRAAVDAAYAGSLREGRDSYEIEHRVVRTATGDIRYVHEKCEHFRDATGRIVRSVGMVHDVTERRAAEIERERLLRVADSQRERFQAVVECAPAGIAVLRPPDFVFDLVNPAYQAIGPDLVMVGRTVAEVFPDLADQVLPLLEGVVRTGEPYHAVDRHFRIRRGPGLDLEDVYFTFTYEPMLDPVGLVEAILVLVVETTEQMLSRVERERLLAELEATLEAAPAGVVIYDRAGQIVRMNASAERILGFPEADLAMPMAELFARLGFEAADGRPLLLDEFPPTLALRGQKVDGVAIAFHRCDQRSDQSSGHPADQARDRKVWIYDGAGPIRARDGTILGAVASFVDVTELRELQEQAQRLLAEQVKARQRIEVLAQTAERRAAELQGVLDNMVDAVFVVDSERRLTLTNAAATRLFGLPSFAEVRDVPAEFPSVLQLRHPGGRPIAPEEMATARALAGETVVSMDQVCYNPQVGQDRYIQVSAAPIRDGAGGVLGAVVVARDVSELTELERLKDQFISVAAHELKTPVAVMKGYAELLLRSAADRLTDHRRVLEAIDRGATRIDRIVRDLLDVSQLHLGRFVLRRERVDLAELVQGVVDRVAARAINHPVRLSSVEAASVDGDRDRLEDVALTLLDNAIRYSPEGGDVDVTVLVQRGEVIVSVKDQGVGIPMGMQARIFERFYRAHTGTPYDYGGMGVGLYIASEVIRRLGGRMWFESAEGKGSSFSFSLPLKGDDECLDHGGVADG